jgi:tRNA dimethylallyltransferase
VKVVFVVGTTASGKSDLALELAQKFGGAIINADSVQIYQHVLIGSAAPTKAEFEKVPHFLFQRIAPPEKITAGIYSRLARETLDECRSRFKVVFVVGGTGFYFQALENGMLPVEKADEEIKAQLQAELENVDGARNLYLELQSRDPLVAARISVNDHYRLVRALEIIRRTGRSLSEIEKEYKDSKPDFPFPLLKLGVQVEREELKNRVRSRTQAMLKQGLVQETQALIARGLRDWDPLQSVGYKEAGLFLNKDPELPDLAALEERINHSTLHVAKRQRTWFQRDERILWGQQGDVPFFTSRVQEFLGESST